MPAGVIFRVGGALDPSYKTALAQSVAEAKAAAIAINRTSMAGDSVNSAVLISSARGRKEVEVLRKQQRDLKVLQSSMIASSVLASKEKFQVADAIAKKEAEIEVVYAREAALKVAQIRYDAGLALSVSQVALMRESQAAQTAIVAAQTAEQVAIVRAGAIAEVEARIAANASGVSSGMGSHGRGGMTGIIRESLVIMREAAMGRGGPRIAGSATLLAQYLGVLNLAVKSTAAPALEAAAAAEALAIKLDLVAAASVGTATETVALEAAQKQQIVVTEAQTAANRALLSAVVTLNPIFWATVGILVAVGTAAGFIIYHFHKLSVEAKNLADALNPLKKKFTELAEAQDKAAKAGQENSDWLKELNDRHRSESEQIERKIKLLKEEWAARKRLAEARGASDGELKALDMASLQAEQQMLLVEQARLKTENDKAQAAEKSASDAAIAGPTTTDEKGRTITYDQAKENVKKRGDILDAAQEEMDNTKGIHTNEIEGYAPGAGVSVPIYKTRSANESDVLDFKVGTKSFSMSVAEAKKNFDFMNEKVRKLATDQAALDAVLKSAKSTATEKMDAQNRVNEDLESVADEMKTTQESPRTRHGGANREATERERVGIGAPQVANLQKQTLDVSKLQLAAARLLNSKIDKLIASGGGALNPDGW